MSRACTPPTGNDVPEKVGGPQELGRPRNSRASECGSTQKNARVKLKNNMFVYKNREKRDC